MPVDRSDVLVVGADFGTLSGRVVVVRSPALLVRNRRVPTIGATAAAVEAAVMYEDVARAVHTTRQLGIPLPTSQSRIDALHAR
jgi:hypothetical protein